MNPDKELVHGHTYEHDGVEDTANNKDKCNNWNYDLGKCRIGGKNPCNGIYTFGCCCNGFGLIDIKHSKNCQLCNLDERE